MSITTALTTIEIETAPIEHPDAWIPMRYADLDDIRNALRHAQRLETGLLQIIGDLQASIAPAADGDDPAPVISPQEHQEPDNDAPFDWPRLALEDLGRAYAGYLLALDDGTLTWRKLEPDTQETLILWIISRIHRRLGRFTGMLWDKHRPAGIISISALHARMTLTQWTEMALSRFAGPEAAGEDFRDE